MYEVNGNNREILECKFLDPVKDVHVYNIMGDVGMYMTPSEMSWLNLYLWLKY